MHLHVSAVVDGRYFEVHFTHAIDRHSIASGRDSQELFLHFTVEGLNYIPKMPINNQ